MRSSAAVVRLRPAQPIKLDTGPESVDWIASEIRLSGLSYKEIEERTDIGATTISRLASGETRMPRWSTLVKIALALGWSIYAHNDRASR